MISLISIEEFVDKIYTPVHGRRTPYACKLVKTLRNAGITDLKTLVHHRSEDLSAISNIGPVFIVRVNLHLGKVGCSLGMTDKDLKCVILSRL